MMAQRVQVLTLVQLIVTSPKRGKVRVKHIGENHWAVGGGTHNRNMSLTMTNVLRKKKTRNVAAQPSMIPRILRERQEMSIIMTVTKETLRTLIEAPTGQKMMRGIYQ